MGNPVVVRKRQAVERIRVVSIGDVEAQAHTLPGVGLTVLASGDVASAGALFGASAPLAQSIGEAGDWMHSLVQVWLGTVEMLQGDPAAAIAPIERGLASARARGDRLTIYVALFNLSQVAITQGDHGRALACLEEGIHLSEEIRDLTNLAYFLDALAVVEGPVGSPARVATLLGAAQSLRGRSGPPAHGYDQPDETLRDGAAADARATLGEDGYDDAIDVGRSMDITAAVAYALFKDS